MENLVIMNIINSLLKTINTSAHQEMT